MIWNINTIVPIIAFGLYSGLFLLVAVSKPRTPPRNAFRLYLLSMAIWSLSAVMVLIDTQRTFLWFRFMSASGLASFITIFYFVQKIVDRKLKWSIAVILYGFLAYILTISTRLVILNATTEGGVITHYEFGPFVGVLIGPGYLVGLYSLYELIRGYREATDLVQRNRLWYLIAGIGFMMMSTLVNFTPLGKYPLDIAANGITALVIAYSILRYQLLDIRVVIRQGLLYSIPTILIGSAYFLIISFAVNVVPFSSQASLFLLSLAVAVVTALLAEPLRLRAQHVIDRMFFREKYDSRLMLQTLSGRVSSVLDLYELTDMILDELVSTLHIPKAAFFLRDEESGKFQLTSQKGLGHVSDMSFRPGHPVVLWLSTHDQPLSKHGLEVHPQFRSLWTSESLDLAELDVELLIPLKVQKELIGVFSIGPKRSEQDYSEDEQLMLMTLANQTAVAIENARLYTSEQNRLKEMDTLYSMARRLVATDKLEDVLATVAQHAAESIEAAYARILLREENGDYSLQAVYPANMLSADDQMGGKEPLVAEYYYNWILQRGEAVVVFRDDPSLHDEEKAVLFFQDARAVCLSPLKGVERNVGLLILGDDQHNHKESFPSAKVRLINVISDYATSAIQRAMLLNRLEESFLQTVISLANAMDARDTYTGDHSQRMAELAFRMGEAMRLPPEETEMLHWAAILHDIGKIGVPDEILNKQGPLTKEEWVIMKEHPVIGAQIVEPVKYLSAVSPLIRSHHEKYDGTGYPYGLQGEDIPLGSRILAVVDAYVAIRDERVYSKSHTHEEAIAELRRFSGTQFDPKIVDVFCNLVSSH
jgi:putative nucleotidyltransferase with HDIG domain